MLLESSREHFTILIIILVWSETKSALVVMVPRATGLKFWAHDSGSG